ncbi:MAG: prephenate dehydrogenase/arogenate dehydrogenase family protein [Nitrospiraceae bacterium]|nr:MAG: prephenate dehydrogenase/arogenate dehydrogenase family protein [Nitrospiraceae bacterium]
MKITFNNITIIGVGLMGGSFALALKAKGFKGKITGAGRNRKNLIKAKRLGIIDDYTTEYADSVRDADLVLFAVPVGRVETIVKSIRKDIKKGAIVTDVGSVKAQIVRKIGPLMPDKVGFVGAHPIAGRECSGIDCATADLYQNARCIITPATDTNKPALKKVIGLWKSLGAKPVLMDPVEHDLIFGAVSHLPHVVAYALVNSIMKVDSGIIRHGGRGLRDMTRIALSPPELWRDICAYNRQNLLRTMKKFSSSVSHLTGLIERSDWAALEKEFRKAKEARQLLESD